MEGRRSGWREDDPAGAPGGRDRAGFTVEEMAGLGQVLVLPVPGAGRVLVPPGLDPRTRERRIEQALGAFFADALRAPLNMRAHMLGAAGLGDPPPRDVLGPAARTAPTVLGVLVGDGEVAD